MKCLKNKKIADYFTEVWRHRALTEDTFTLVADSCDFSKRLAGGQHTTIDLEDNKTCHT